MFNCSLSKCVYKHLTLYMFVFNSQNVTQLLAWFALTVCIVSIVNLSWYVSAVDGSPQSYHANNFTPCLLQYPAPREQQRANWVFLAYWNLVKCNWIRDNRDDRSVIKYSGAILYSGWILYITYYNICSWAWLEISNGKPHLQFFLLGKTWNLEVFFHSPICNGGVSVIIGMLTSCSHIGMRYDILYVLFYVTGEQMCPKWHICLIGSQVDAIPEPT